MDDDGTTKTMANVRGVLRQLIEFAVRIFNLPSIFFFEFLPRYIGSVLTFALICELLSGFFGDGLGVDNLFHDDNEWRERYMDSDQQAWRNSPVLWTSVWLAVLSITIVWFVANREISDRPNGTIAGWRDRVFELRTFLAVPVVGLGLFLAAGVLYAIAFLVWRHAQRANPVADVLFNIVFGGFAGAAVALVVIFISWLFSHLVLLFTRWAKKQADTSFERLDDLLKKKPKAKWVGSIAGWMMQIAVRTFHVRLDQYKAIARLFIFALPAAIAAWSFLSSPKIIPAVAIFATILFVYLVVATIGALPAASKTIATLVIIALLFRGERPDFQLNLPGIAGQGGTEQYDAPVSLACLHSDASGPDVCVPEEIAPTLTACTRDETTKKSAIVATIAAINRLCTRSDGAKIPPADLIRVKDSLENWHDKVGGGRPKLVMIATSGGAYRSAYWTAMALDKMDSLSTEGSSLEGMAPSVRFVTGASGGMVGASYFAALAEAKFTGPRHVEATLSADIMESQNLDCDSDGVPPEPAAVHGTCFPVPRDSLGPVAQNILQVGLPSFLKGKSGRIDRGEVLERQWITLQSSFADLLAGEREGWRPSLVLTPTIAETGQPLVISNLDLAPLLAVGPDAVRTTESEVFFNLFPCSQQSFKLATAVRMNASFPYVSPAVRLPTCEPRRVVDAGYYDNYGITTATAILSHPDVMSFVKEFTSGVILLELRAFPLDLPGEQRCSVAKDDNEGGISLSAAWLTNPLTAALSSRSASMKFGNQQSLRATRSLYGDPRWIKSFVLVNSADVSLNWYLPKEELADMRTCFSEEWEKIEHDLVEAWGSKWVL